MEIMASPILALRGRWQLRARLLGGWLILPSAEAFGKALSFKSRGYNENSFISEI